MSDRRKALIGLLEQCPCDGPENVGCPDRKHGMCRMMDKLDYCAVAHLADHLIANGVTVLPCKVGDTIFEVDPEHGIIKHNVYEVCAVYKTTATDDKGTVWDDFFTSDDIDTAYKTRDEAKVALTQPPKGEC